MWYKVSGIDTYSRTCCLRRGEIWPACPSPLKLEDRLAGAFLVRSDSRYD